MTEAHLRLERLTKRFGTQLAVDAVSLDIAPGEMMVLLGPSGCGKTTTLRMIAGFVAASSGRIILDGRDIAGVAAHRRQMGIVFQSYALFPHMTVAGNVGFGLEMRRAPRPAIERRVQEMLRLVKLDALARRYPRQLSGGQQQRVALARALAIEPKLLLLDEPLSNLDAALRQDVGREIRLLQRRRGLTSIMVTHDQDEAMAMADRLVVMRDGHVQQIGTQEELYERPANPFVATFIGRSNILRGRIEGGTRLRLEQGPVLRLAGCYAAEGACALAVRPERIALRPADGGGGGAVPGQIVLSNYLGAVAEYVVDVAPELSVVVRHVNAGDGSRSRFATGDRVTLAWTPGGERLFDADDRPLAASAGDRVDHDIIVRGMTSHA